MNLEDLTTLLLSRQYSGEIPGTVPVDVIIVNQITGQLLVVDIRNGNIKLSDMQTLAKIFKK